MAKDKVSEEEVSYEGPDRRRVFHNTLSEEQLEEIAERAAEKAIAKVTQDLYTSIGKAVLTKVVWSVGVAWVALIIWLNAKGFIRF
jgi:hypothetical protein